MMFKTSLLIATSAGLAGMLQGCEPTKEDICENYEDEAKKKQCKEMKKEGKDDDEIKAKLGEPDVKHFCDKYQGNDKSACMGFMQVGMKHDQIKEFLDKKKDEKADKNAVKQAIKGLENEDQSKMSPQEKKQRQEAMAALLAKLQEDAQQNGGKMDADVVQAIEANIGKERAHVYQMRIEGQNVRFEAMDTAEVAQLAKGAFERMEAGDDSELTPEEQKAIFNVQHAFENDDSRFQELKQAMVAAGCDEKFIDSLWHQVEYEEMGPPKIVQVIRRVAKRGPRAPSTDAEIDEEYQAAANVAKAVEEDSTKKDAIAQAMKDAGCDQQEIDFVFGQAREHMRGIQGHKARQVIGERVGAGPRRHQAMALNPKVRAMQMRVQKAGENQGAPGVAAFENEADEVMWQAALRRRAGARGMRGAGKGPAGGHGVRAGKGPGRNVHVEDVDVDYAVGDYGVGDCGDYGVVEGEFGGMGDFGEMVVESDDSYSNGDSDGSDDERDVVMFGAESPSPGRHAHGVAVGVGAPSPGRYARDAAVGPAKRGVVGNKRVRHGHVAHEGCCHN